MPGISFTGGGPEEEPEESPGEKGKGKKPLTLHVTGDATAAAPSAGKAKKAVRFRMEGDTGPGDADVDLDEELAEPELRDSAISVAVAAGTPVDPNLAAPKPKYHKLFDPNKDEDFWCMLRLHKLKNQVGTQELAYANTKTLTEPLSSIARKAITSLVDNLQNQAERTKAHTRDQHYSEEGFNLLDTITEKIHSGITTKEQDNKTIIELPEMTDSQNNNIPKRNITTWPNEAEKRIMFSASHSDDYSLIILIEGALKAAKAMLPTTATFLIFIPPNNPEDTETVAKLCSMANFVGLRPQFQTKPGCEASAKEFSHQFRADYGASPEAVHDDFLTHSEKNPEILKEYLNRIKPINQYTPPTFKKYLK